MVFRSPFEPLASAFIRWKIYSRARPVLLWTQRVALWLPMGIAFTKYGYTLKSVSGRSMQPTLNPDSSLADDVVLFEKCSADSLRKLQRGDIVAVKSPHELGRLLVKRIVALPGDMVQTLPPYPDKEVHLTEGQIWIEGDESFHSQDSNWFGPIPLALVDSKLTHIVYPFARFGRILPPSVIISEAAQKRQGRPAQRDLDAFAREQRRMERITIGGVKRGEGRMIGYNEEGIAGARGDGMNGVDTFKAFEEALEMSRGRGKGV